MLKRLFTSNTRIKLLELFLMNQSDEYFIRQLTRKLDEQINSIRRELDNLKKIGLLKARLKSRKKYYSINKDCIILEDLTNLFSKVLSKDKKIAADLQKIGDIKLLALSGIFANQPESPVDMLIVGEMEREKLTNYINNDLNTSKPVKFTLLSEEDYQYRMNCNDQFLIGIVTNEKNAIPINKIA